MSNHPATTADTAEAFRQDGVVHLPQVLDEQWIELVETGLNRAVRNPGPLASRLYEGTEREMYLDHCNWGAIPEFHILLRDSPIVDIVGEVMQSKELWMFFEQVWVKNGGTGRRTPWHQDATYWITGGPNVCGFWITLDPVPAEQSLEFVRGSHQGPLYAGTSFDPDDETAPYYPEAEWPRLPDIQADRSAYDIVSFPNEPGDVVMFHPAILHGGGASEGMRRTVSLRFFGDDTVYEPRPGKASPPFPGVAATHTPGDPLRSSWFPQVLPRPATPIW